jgi:hypothetical protein
LRGGGPRGPDRAFLRLWLGGALLGTIVLLPFGAARYLLTVLPPLLLLLARTPLPQGRVGLAVAASALVSLLLGAADYEYAEAYRTFARGLPPETRVWFTGDWGFRRYMEEGGHRYLLSSNASPAVGERIVEPRTAGLHDFAPGLRGRLEHVESVEFPGRLPVRLMSAEAKAGFYSHGWGLLPFAVSSGPLETFDVFRVREAVP